MILRIGKYISYIIEYEIRNNGWDIIGMEYQDMIENINKDYGWNYRVIEKKGIFWDLFQDFILLRKI